MSKTVAIDSAGMPTPLSSTSIKTSLPSRTARKAMWPPAGVYLAALLSKLPSTCASRVGSASSGNACSSSFTCNW
ncbi:hypothetical protein JAB9_00770 [Janthinobacterium sp. HH107]|nr:hypothetical protein JAB8_07430 [Janthinobacterium sp. HH106]OFA08496.1 hypothetical protein JAB9_00770 [Janthinobacterium sp. HH107]